MKAWRRLLSAAATPDPVMARHGSAPQLQVSEALEATGLVRYARGEIDRDTYARMLEDLRRGPGADRACHVGGGSK